MTDLSLVEEAVGDPALLAGTTLPIAFTPRDGIAFIERQWSRQDNGEGVSLAITVDGEAVGCATLIVRRPGTADLGYWLVRRARGRRIATTAVSLLVDWALREPEIDAVEAFVDDENGASRKLLARLGFALVGRRRHVVNELDAELLVYRLAAGPSGE